MTNMDVSTANGSNRELGKAIFSEGSTGLYPTRGPVDSVDLPQA